MSETKAADDKAKNWAELSDNNEDEDEVIDCDYDEYENEEDK